MRLEASRRAERQIRAAARWWAANRDKAPLAFEEELERAQAMIAATPTVGRVVLTRSRPARRITLERIRYYLYYRIHSDWIEVIAFWHTSRRPPRL